MSLETATGKSARTAGRRVLVLVAMGVGALLLGSGVAVGVTNVSCAGGGVLCEGTDGDEYIAGTSVKVGSFKKGSKQREIRKAERQSRDYILARGGNDVVSGGRGNDVIIGGLGDDGLSGGADDDAISSADGVEGNDRVVCGPGRDRAVVDSAEEADGSTCESVIDVEGAEATGLLQKPERLGYSYGRYFIVDEASGERYVLTSNEVDLDAYVDEQVTIRGWVVPGYEEGQIDGGPALVAVYAVEE